MADLAELNRAVRALAERVEQLEGSDQGSRIEELTEQVRALSEQLDDTATYVGELDNRIADLEGPDQA